MKKDEQKKICPLLLMGMVSSNASHPNSDPFCIEDQCAWWAMPSLYNSVDKRGGGCALCFLDCLEEK